MIIYTIILFYRFDFEISSGMGFPDSSVSKESTCNAGDPSSIPGLGRSTGKGIGYPLQCSWTSPVAQLVKNPPAMWEIWVQSLSWEDPLEKGKVTTPVFWPGEFHGVTKSLTQLSDFHFQGRQIYIMEDNVPSGKKTENST